MTLSTTCAEQQSSSPPRSPGKERDSESGLDYFGARYYSENDARFMSPDWSAKVEPVPYAKLNDPQSLNLYDYMRDNPLGGVDPDGHYFVVGAQNQKFYQRALSAIYRRPGGRELVNALANSSRPVLLDRGELNTAQTGQVGVSTALTVNGEAGVQGVHVTVGTNKDLSVGEQAAPGQVGPAKTTAHELEHAEAGLSQGKTSLQAGAAAMAAGDAPSSPGAQNTLGGSAQAGANAIMGQRPDMSGKDANAAVHNMLQSGQQQWQNSSNRSAICSQNSGACH